MVRSSLTKTYSYCLGKTFLYAVLKAQSDQTVKLHFNHSGGYYQEATPVPIPNTVVKLFGVDNTCLVTGREDRSLPDLMGGCCKMNFNVQDAAASIFL